jgi:uncharacterized protein (DUF2225 family)
MRSPKKAEAAKERKTTYFKRESTVCPACDKPFLREELFQGRVNAGDLTDELHRLYSPMAAYGEVYPLVYPITVCPNCYFAALPQDFENLNAKIQPVILERISNRIDSVGNLFPAGLDFSSPRRLQEGAASYFLMMQSYDCFPDKEAPVIKQAIASLRAAWLFQDMDKKYPKQNYDYVSRLFYKKATFLYQLAIEYDGKGKQALSSVKFLGPDTDTNFGYDGVLYLAAMLELKYGQREDQEKREKKMDYFVMAIAKMFGLGRKTKSKPGPLLERARELYDRLKVEANKKYDDGE